MNTSPTNPIIERQLDALARGLALGLGPRTADVFHALAAAESTAQFVCGFDGLAEATDELGTLEAVALERGIVTVGDNGVLALTATGQARSAARLPEPIEVAVAEGRAPQPQSRRDWFRRGR